MKAILCKQHGLPETLVLEEILSPKPGPNQLVISVKACSVNFPDVLIIQNLYQFKPELPFSPGSEVAGIVKEVGSEVKGFKPGDRVLALCGFGGFAEELLVNANQVFPLYPEISFINGASVMYNYGTSYHALKDRAELKKGETILILGASGGVGLAAVEIAKNMGAVVIAAASNDEKLAICKEKGADFLINYSTEDLREKIKEFTNNKGVDVVYDPIGDKYTEPCLRSMAWKGRYLVVGFAAGEIPKIPLNLALLKGCSIVGVFWGQFAKSESEKSLKNILELGQMFINGKLKPHIHKLYSLDQTIEALHDMQNRKVIGKAVVIMDENIKNEPLAITNKLEILSVEIDSKGKVIFDNFDQIKAFQGKSFNFTDWVKIDQQRINDFADATIDHQWIHIDAEKAKSAPFGQTIAHGLLILSLTPKFMAELYEIKNIKMGINYGTEKVRFLSPVLSGSNLRMTGILKHVSEMPNNGLKMIVEASIEIEGKSKPACVAELISVVYQ